MFDAFRQRLGEWIAPRREKPAVRSYKAGRAGRLTAGWLRPTSSADAELKHSLELLRNGSRQLVRDSGHAKRAKAIVVNNVVGAGVGLQAQVLTTRGEPSARVNAQIESEFAHWSRAENCHTGGALHFADLERAAMGEVFEAGECLLRLHPRAFGESRVPLAIELIEPECLADDRAVTAATAPGNEMRLGVECDRFGRAVAYWIRDQHPGDISRYASGGRTAGYERVPAAEIIHLKLADRWPQTRGVPWLHAAANKLRDMDEYGDAELTAAKMSSMYFGTLESGEDNPLGSETASDGTQQMAIEAGIIDRLAPGEKFNFHAPNRPNAALDAFMRTLLREVAAGIGVSYESLSRDYSQSNYSSSRLALLDDRDLWRVLQQWWVRSFRERLHRVWLERAVLARAVAAVGVPEYVADPERFQAVRWKLRGWSWVDPTKEVAAYKEAVKAGFMSIAKVVEMTGQGDDLEDVVEQRKAEIELFEEADVPTDTGGEAPAPAPAVPNAGTNQPDSGTPAEADDDDEQDDATPSEPPVRLVSRPR
jgi:lambda family phage portal protein